MALVILSYLLAIAVALACIAFPAAMFVLVPMSVGSAIVPRILVSAFGLVAGCTLLWSLVPQKNEVEVQGVLVDLSKQPRLASHLEEIAEAMQEPMPSEVYLIADANAFVTQVSGGSGSGNRRIMGLGLPLLQMLTIAQFRAVLAHEFGHYYAGDTRLSPIVYSTRQAMARAFQNLGRKSEVLSFLRRWAVVSAAYFVLMNAMRMYWKLFMRMTQMISRRQEYRSDELACHVAGSDALIEGLEKIHRCSAAIGAYWNSIVFPITACGFRPQLAEGFQHFMDAPQIAKATADSLVKRITETKSDPFDTHPPLHKRIEAAKRFNLPAPVSAKLSDGFDLPMISLIDSLDSLESTLLKKFVPALAKTELKPIEWESAGSEIYIPKWRKQVALFFPQLSNVTLSALPSLVANPQSISDHVVGQPGFPLDRKQRESKALEVLSNALALCLLDHGWNLILIPGTFRLECGDAKLEPATTIAAMRSGKLTLEQWHEQCAQNHIGDWRMASATKELTNA